MRYSEALNRIKGLIFAPNEEWEKIKSQDWTVRRCVAELVTPLMLMYLISSLLGYIIFTNDIEHSVWYKFSYLLGKMFIMVMSFILTFFLIKWWLSKTNIELSKRIFFKIIFYPYTIAWLVAILTSLLSNYSSLCRFLHFLALYGVIHFLLAFELFTKLSKDTRLRFYPLAIAIMILVYWGMYFLLDEWLSSMVLLSLFFQM